MKLIDSIRKNQQLAKVLKKTKTTTAAIPTVEEPTLQTWIKSIDTAVQTVVKRAVTKKDLVDIGLVTINNGNLESLIPKDPEYSPTVPEAVKNLYAGGAYSSVTLMWDTPVSRVFGHNAVYRSETNDFGTAMLIGSTLGDVYTDYVGNDVKAYYWVRTISKYDVEGELAPSVYAETSIDVAYLLEQLTGQINDSQFDQSLREQIASIYTEAAAKIEIQKQILAERTEVLQRIADESEARVDALKQQADDLRGEINQKAQDSAQEIHNLSQDLAQELLDRQALSERVDGVVSQTDDNTALVGKLEKTFTSKIESIAQEVTLVSAGVGEQFDTLFIYFFDTIETEETETQAAVWSAEGWTSQGGAPTVLNGWIKPYLNGANTVLISPVVEPFSGSAYSYVRFRIKKVGNPVWIGELVHGDTTLVIPEPTWDILSNIATVNFNAEWTGDIEQVSLKLAELQDASNYYLLDWFAFGRPSPGASWSAIGEVKLAIANETEARTKKTETIEASISDNDTIYRALVQDAVDLAAEANLVTGQRLESFILDVSPRWAGSEDENAGSESTQVGTWTETTARIEGDMAQAAITQQLFVDINNRVDADVTKIEKVIADKDSSYALQFNGINAKMVGIPDGANFNTVFTAGINELREAIVDEQGFLATSSLFQNLKSGINNEMTSQIDELKRTYADTVFTESIVYQNLTSATGNAQSTANDALKAADDAQKAADKATEQLNDISADNKLTPLEKQQLKLVWDEIVKTHTELIKQATTYAIGTSTYTPIYNTLNTYITPLLADMNATSDIVRATFQANFANHYAARAELGNAIATKAKSLSDGAKQTADDAKAAAEAAKGVADKATNQLADIASDSKLTPLEKQQLSLIWGEVVKTHTELTKQAVNYGVSTTNYTPTYTALNSYVTPLLADMSATSTIVRSTFQTNFTNHYEARAVLGNAIATKAKQLSDDAKAAADNAKGAADNAKKAADDAQKAANDAQATADKATGQLSDIAADSKLTASEKQQLKLVWDEIVKTHTELAKQATSYDIAQTAYTPTYTTLNTYITPLLADMTATSDIVRATFQANFANHYAARAVLSNQIAVKAKTLADNAKKAADDAQKKADDAFTLGGGAQAAIDQYDRTYTEKFLGAAESVKSIEASYNANYAGSTEDLAGSDAYAGVFTVWSAIAEGDLALSQQTDQLSAQFNQAQADYQQQQILVAEELRALSTTSTTLQANLDKGLDGVKKDIATVKEDMVAVVDDRFGTASGKITSLEKVVDGQKTSLEIVNAVGDVNLVKHEIAKSRLDKNIADLQLKKASTNSLIAELNKQIAALNLKKTEEGANIAEINAQLAELQEAKTEAEKILAGIDPQITQIQEDKNTLDSLLKTDSKIKAQSTIKLDGDGVIASIGLAIEEDGAGTPQSVIAFRSHRFYVVPPGMDLTKGVVPFIIDDGKVIIDVALIKDGSIESAKVGSLAADKITTGDIAADRMKANIVKAVSVTATTMEALNLKVKRGDIDDLAVDTLQIANNAVTVPVAVTTAAAITVGTTYTTVQSLSVPSDMGHTLLTFGAVFSFIGYSDAQQIYCRILKDNLPILEDVEVHFNQHEAIATTSAMGGEHFHNARLSLSGSTGNAGSHSHGNNFSIRSDGNHSHGATGGVSVYSGGSHSHSMSGSISSDGSHNHSVSITGSVDIDPFSNHSHGINVQNKSRSAGTINLVRHDSSLTKGTFAIQLRAVQGGNISVSQRYIHAMTLRK